MFNVLLSHSLKGFKNNTCSQLRRFIILLQVCMGYQPFCISQRITGITKERKKFLLEGLTIASLGTSKVPVQAEHPVPSEIHGSYVLRSHNAVDHHLISPKTQTYIFKHLKLAYIGPETSNNRAWGTRQL